MESFIRSTWNWSKNLHNHDIKIEKNYLIYILIKASITTIHMHPYVRIKKLRAFSANSESHVGSRVRKEAKRHRRKSTCLKEAGCSLLANLVARPACHGTVIHFRDWCVVESGPVKLLVLSQVVRDGWRARGRYVRITWVRYLDELAGIIECPMKSHRCRMALDGAH